MTIDVLREEIRGHYQQLASSVSALRLWQTRCVDDLAARQRQAVDELARSFAARRHDAEAARQKELAVGDEALASASQDIHADWQEDRAAFPYLAAPWEDSVWQGYAPSTDGPVASAMWAAGICPALCPFWARAISS